jgi:rod shape-determining protein MreC
MFSNKKMMIGGVILLVVANIVILSITSRRHHLSSGPGPVLIGIVGPFQAVATRSIQITGNIWRHYFSLVSVARENDILRKALARAVQENKKQHETALSNQRLRSLLNFTKTISGNQLAAEVIGLDPSFWFKSITINKGKLDGIRKGMPVVIPDGIVGQIGEVSGHYAKALLAIDRNSAVDALVQRSRARGVIKGNSSEQYRFNYVLRKNDVQVGDTIISSGMDGVFPKGIRIGEVTDIVKRNSGIFQEVTVVPYVDFEKLEEVLVIQTPSQESFVETQ